MWAKWNGGGCARRANREQAHLAHHGGRERSHRYRTSAVQRFWEYISNSEAVSLAWVIKRSCTEAKGAPLVMIAIQHDDLGGQPELGDRLCDSHMVEEFLDDAVSRRFGVDNPWRQPKHTTELHNVPNSPEVPELSDRADLPEASDLL